MVKMYYTDVETNDTSETKIFQKGNWINMINPTKDEIELICEAVNIEPNFIHYALDAEEKARIDMEDDGTILFIIDVPVSEEENGNIVYTTMPVGIIIVRDEFLITVSLKENALMTKMEQLVKKKSIASYKKSQFLFQVFYENSSMYLNMLKIINKKTELLEKTLKKSLKNEDLMKMLNIEKSLVYFTTSLKSNEIVMEKTLRGKIIKLYEEDEDLLEDSIIENKQAMEVAKTYSDILNETMDVYASVISNNINDVMKFLTTITIILAVPTLIASIWGMNVPVPLQYNQYGFVILIVASIIITLLTMIWFKKKDMLR